MTRPSAASCREKAKVATARADAAHDYDSILAYDGLARDWLSLAARCEREDGPVGVDTINTHVALQLRQRRCEMGLSREDLADLCGVPEARIEQYESGRTVVWADSLWRLSTGLKRPVDFFYPSRTAS